MPGPGRRDPDEVILSPFFRRPGTPYGGIQSTRRVSTHWNRTNVRSAGRNTKSEGVGVEVVALLVVDRTELPCGQGQIGPLGPHDDVRKGLVGVQAGATESLGEVAVESSFR